MATEASQLFLLFLEGIGIALSPCILPILPFLFATAVQSSKWNPVKIIIGFVISFNLVAISSRYLLIWLDVSPDIVQTIAYMVLLLLGFIMVIPYLEKSFAGITMPLSNTVPIVSQNKKSMWNGFLLGVVLGMIWTPCAGPLLAIALVQVLQTETPTQEFQALFAFSLGVSLPMLVMAYFGKWVVERASYATKMGVVIKKVLGCVVILFSVFGLLGLQWELYLPLSEPSKQNFTNKLENGIILAYPAPNFFGITKWINSPPLTMKELKGKVVLVDFWTYSCINCLRTLPYVKQWYASYHDRGLTIVGVHTPEYGFESSPNNVKKAIEELGILYPVALDNDFKTWDAYKNHFWPSHYLINKEGMVVYQHYGEGDYDVIENNIRYLLNIPPMEKIASSVATPTSSITPETHLGSLRMESRYIGQETLPLHQWKLKGKWLVKPEYIEALQAGDTVSLHYQAKQVYLVMSTKDKKPIRIKVKNNQEEKVMSVQESKLYLVCDNRELIEGILTIEVTTPGVRIYSFSFGG